MVSGLTMLVCLEVTLLLVSIHAKAASKVNYEFVLYFFFSFFSFLAWFSFPSLVSISNYTKSFSNVLCTIQFFFSVSFNFFFYCFCSETSLHHSTSG